MGRGITFLLILMIQAPFGLSQGIFHNATVKTDTSDDQDKTEWNGYVRSIYYGGAKNTDYSSLFGEMALSCRFSSVKTFFTGEMRFREGILFDKQESVWELKEAYAGYKGRNFNLCLGNQIVSWGRTDGFNPTNNISPADYFFLTPEADDQKLANFMLRAGLRIISSTELEIVVIPVYKPSVYRYSLFDMGAGASFNKLVLPDPAVRNATLGVRFNAELPDAGFSFSWFHGYDPFYGFTIDSLSLYPVSAIYYRPSVYHKNTLGADFAIPVKSTVLRGEMAVNFVRNPTAGMYIPFPNFAWVAAAEHNFSGITAIFQYIGKCVFHFKPLIHPEPDNPQNPADQSAYAAGMIYYESQLFNRKIFSQQKESNHALFLSLSKQFFYDVLSLEMSGYYNLSSREWMVRSAFKWKLSDALTSTWGFSTMQGPRNTVFDKAGKVLNGIFAGLTASF